MFRLVSYQTGIGRSSHSFTFQQIPREFSPLGGKLPNVVAQFVFDRMVTNIDPPRTLPCGAIGVPMITPAFQNLLRIKRRIFGIHSPSWLPCYLQQTLQNALTAPRQRHREQRKAGLAIIDGSVGIEKVVNFG
jgi:hypothetical protein